MKKHVSQLPNGAFRHTVPIPPNLSASLTWTFLASLYVHKPQSRLKTTTHLPFKPRIRPHQSLSEPEREAMEEELLLIEWKQLRNT
ncbi:hypothetical protein GCM10027299_09210 [Larkinella ripae]